MSESFVDLTYRGLPFGQRIKLTQVRPSSGYLEIAAPMPVGSRIAIAAEEGVVIDAVVALIHEQASGERPPGMLVAPALDTAWWQERVTLPELPPKPAPVVRAPPPPEPALALADDEKRTVAMDAVDLSALGLEAGSSGQLAASTIDESLE